jgi:hypothetical protein
LCVCELPTARKMLSRFTRKYKKRESECVDTTTNDDNEADSGLLDFQFLITENEKLKAQLAEQVNVAKNATAEQLRALATAVALQESLKTSQEQLDTLRTGFMSLDEKYSALKQQHQKQQEAMEACTTKLKAEKEELAKRAEACSATALGMRAQTDSEGSIGTATSRADSAVEAASRAFNEGRQFSGEVLSKIHQETLSLRAENERLKAQFNDEQSRSAELQAEMSKSKASSDKNVAIVAAKSPVVDFDAATAVVPGSCKAAAEAAEKEFLQAELFKAREEKKLVEQAMARLPLEAQSKHEEEVERLRIDLEASRRNELHLSRELRLQSAVEEMRHGGQAAALAAERDEGSAPDNEDAEDWPSTDEETRLLMDTPRASSRAIQALAQAQAYRESVADVRGVEKSSSAEGGLEEDLVEAEARVQELRKRLLLQQNKRGTEESASTAPATLTPQTPPLTPSQVPDKALASKTAPTTNSMSENEERKQHTSEPIEELKNPYECGIMPENCTDAQLPLQQPTFIPAKTEDGELVERLMHELESERKRTIEAQRQVEDLQRRKDAERLMCELQTERERSAAAQRQVEELQGTKDEQETADTSAEIYKLGERLKEVLQAEMRSRGLDGLDIDFQWDQASAPRENMDSVFTKVESSLEGSAHPVSDSQVSLKVAAATAHEAKAAMIATMMEEDEPQTRIRRNKVVASGLPDSKIFALERDVALDSSLSLEEGDAPEKNVELDDSDCHQEDDDDDDQWQVVQEEDESKEDEEEATEEEAKATNLKFEAGSNIRPGRSAEKGSQVSSLKIKRIGKQHKSKLSLSTASSKISSDYSFGKATRHPTSEARRVKWAHHGLETEAVELFSMLRKTWGSVKDGFNVMAQLKDNGDGTPCSYSRADYGSFVEK